MNQTISIQRKCNPQMIELEELVSFSSLKVLFYTQKVISVRKYTRVAAMPDAKSFPTVVAGPGDYPYSAVRFLHGAVLFEGFVYYKGYGTDYFRCNVQTRQSAKSRKIQEAVRGQTEEMTSARFFSQLKDEMNSLSSFTIGRLRDRNIENKSVPETPLLRELMAEKILW